MIQLCDTLIFVMTAHSGQTDKAGMPYWTHPFRCMQRIQHSDPTSKLTADQLHFTQEAALLHDAVEDTTITTETLMMRGYSTNTCEIVDLVTKDTTLTYAENIERIIDSGDILAGCVKLVDNYDNSCPSRLKSLPQPKALSLQKRYTKARSLLERKFSTQIAALGFILVSGDIAGMK